MALTAKSNKVEKLIQDITNRYRVTAREARDIITAAGTVVKTDNSPQQGMGFRGTSRKTAVKNLKKQVVETAKAAATGKKGTTSDINARMLNKGFLKGDINLFEGYEKGKKT